MNTRVIAGNEVTIRAVICFQCEFIDKHASAAEVRAHVKSTGHRIHVQKTVYVTYSREMTP